MNIKLSITQGVFIGTAYLKNIFPFKETEMSVARIIKGDKGEGIYTHPENHPASIIIETAEKQFVSDEQIKEWDSKSAKGDKGDTGAQGLKGDKGNIGAKGEQGIKGADGEKGANGANGVKGDDGEQGIQGVKGDKGDVGATGAKGLNGSDGAKGDKGDKGDVVGINLEAVLIPYGSDLNDYKDIGFYYSPASASNIANRPRGVVVFSLLPEDPGFALLIEKHTGVKQTFSTDHPTSPIVYIRQFIPDVGWSEWSVVNAKGDKGEQGLKGVKGDIGATGLKGDKGDTGAATKIAETATTKQIRPNTFHVWGSISSLSITLASETANRYNEYMFQFISGATATTLTLPSSVILPEGFSIKANKTYQISIVNNLLIMGEW